MTPTETIETPTDAYAAPGDLELARAFANTIDVEDVRDEWSKEDDFSDPSLYRRWLVDHGLVSERDRVTAADLRTAVALRDAIRGLAYANHGEPVPPSALPTLDLAASRAGFTARFRADGPPVLVPGAKGADAALGRIVAIVFAAMSDGTWSRLKICRADTCAWAFYDHSKNQSRAWCSMKICGNRTKARNYRRRASRQARTSS
jgi:predicted RNA-binding Zn ribbon-like protein